MTHTTLSLPKGYMGNMLFLNLSTKTFDVQAYPPELAQQFFGGRGVGIAVLFQHFSALKPQGNSPNPFQDIDPLSAENALVISTSPTTGTRMPTSGRFHLNFKSPLTGGVGSSNAGGTWGVALKKAGYDVVVITGKAEQPVYPVISSEGVDVFDATPFKGTDTETMTDRIAEQLPQGARVLTIGEAGQKHVYFASITNEKGRSFGRGGGGAVFGAKNLYALAVVPDSEVSIPVADDMSFTLHNQQGAGFKAKMKLEVGKFTRKEAHYGSLSSMGSLSLCGMVYNYGQLVHRNMQDTTHRPEDAAKISGEALRRHAEDARPGETTIEVKKGTCYSCPILCKRITRIVDGNGRVIDEGEGPEFETVALLGANLELYDLPLITQANYLANRYGLDTISLGSTIAAFFELYELASSRGEDVSPQEARLLNECQEFIKEYGEPGFGKAEVLLPLIHHIGQSQGIGKYLALGSYRFCERYGHPERSMTVKKQELPAYDPRTSFSQALGYEMSNRGGCHLEGGYTAPMEYCAGYGEWPGDRIEGTALISKNAALRNTTVDIIGACIYSAFSLTLDEYALLVNAVTGLDYNAGKLEEIAWRTFTLERLFNVQCGFTKDDDWLPDRFFEEPVQTGERTIRCERGAFQQMHQDYYEAMGWDEHGVPTSETLKKLGIPVLI